MANSTLNILAWNNTATPFHVLGIKNFLHSALLQFLENGGTYANVNTLIKNSQRLFGKC